MLRLFTKSLSEILKYVFSCRYFSSGIDGSFRTKYPKRFINTGVAEQSMVGIAAGMALRGLKPFCYTIATFALYRPFEMVEG